ncbi:DUF445 domain-containing protein [Austwickia chelonae]|uniref:DUF445 domain-containing protein n=1 Tax=Austwickia chelonae NBRC 105200 TaxID=1184607 RepID=K6VKQ0_9MICO|nr:DUF445 domain-containing protein [Austwickia chelonae]GAB77319.1 hypothetical protein AUCHE_05_02240 [Austwickia chelonae NBRC 105200]
MPTIALSVADEQRRRDFVRMRRIATSLLVIAALIFLATLHQGGFWGYVNAAAEAAMVGALADWFAVTALFRHPLGIPIPHTALVPKKKDTFARGLEDFVTGNFLTGEAARERFMSADVSRRLGVWLDDEENARRLADESAQVLSHALTRVEVEDLRTLVEHSVIPRLDDEPLSPVAGALLAEIVRDGLHHSLVDLLVIEAHAWLRDNPETFNAIVGERAPGWTPGWVNGMIADRAHLEAVSWVCAVRDDPDHRIRAALDDLLSDLARDMQQDPATMERLETLKSRLLTHPQTSDAALAIAEVLRAGLQRALEDPEGLLRSRIAKELRRLGERLTTEEDLRERVDARAGDAIAFMVDSYGGELAPIISQVIARWDGQEAAEKIELHVGRDLQFIRINGTLVGGLAGLLIHTFSQMVAG